MDNKNTTDMNTEPKQRTEMQVNGWNLRFSKRKNKWQVKGKAYDHATEELSSAVRYESDTLTGAMNWAKTTPYFTTHDNVGECGMTEFHIF